MSQSSAARTVGLIMAGTSAQVAAGRRGGAPRTCGACFGGGRGAHAAGMTVRAARTCKANWIGLHIGVVDEEAVAGGLDDR